MRAMPRWQRIFLAACAANLGYALGYVAADYLRLPRFIYFPLEREWRWSEPVPGVPIGFVGLWSWALAIGAASLLVAWFFPRKTPLGTRGLGLWGAWAATATALALAYYTWNNWP